MFKPYEDTCTISDFSTLDTDSLKKRYIALLELIEKKEPQLRILEEDLRPDLVFDELNAQVRKFSGRTRPALFGVPVGVKGVYRTANYHIRCGSLLPKTLFEGKEADIVSRLKEAGAVVTGITSTAEFAALEPPATVNPHNCAHTPGGSSSGSAAGICAGYFPVSLGTQTIGSVIRPASYCGVYGFKPSQSSLSIEGIIPYSVSVDQPGFFTSTIGDLRTVLQVLVRDCSPSERVSHKLRVGIIEGEYYELFAESTKNWFASVRSIIEEKEDGINFIPFDPIGNPSVIKSLHQALISHDAALYHKDYLGEFGHLYRSQTLSVLRQGLEVSTNTVNEAKQSQHYLRQKIMQQMDDNNLDCIMTPASLNSAPLGLSSTGDPAACIPWTHSGLPSAVIPTPLALNGMPQGLQIICRYGDDGYLCDCSQVISSLLLNDS